MPEKLKLLLIIIAGFILMLIFTGPLALIIYPGLLMAVVCYRVIRDRNP